MFDFELEKFQKLYPIINSYLPQLKVKLTEEKYYHSLGTMWMSYQLAVKFGSEDIYEKAVIAGLLHDCAKCLPVEKLLELARHYQVTAEEIGELNSSLLHGPIGAFVAVEDYGILDINILNAIRFHTTGREKMRLLEKIIFIADYVEPMRKHPGVDDIRTILATDLDKAIVAAIDKNIFKILEKGHFLHINTIQARNDLIFKNNI